MSDSSNEAMRLAAEAEEAPEVPQQPDTPEGVAATWRPETAADVDWALSVLGQAQRELAELDAQHRAALARLEERKRKVAAPLERTVAFFTAHLQAWAEDNRSTICTGKRKSRNFLHGRVGFRQRPERLVVKDEAAALAWVRRQQEEEGLVASLFIREVPVLEGFRTYAANTGSEPDGCEFVGGDETFSVTAEAAEE